MSGRWWAPDRHADRRPALVTRARTLAAVRSWFEEEGFVEVDPPALAASPGAETHIAAFEARGAGETAYLHTSPEFLMKKLLAAGESRIYALGKVYRAGERGPLHAPEFTMLEWYRAEQTWPSVARDALTQLAIACDVAGAAKLTRAGRSCDPYVQAEWIPVADAFQRHAGVSLMHTISLEGRPDGDMLATEARRIGVRVAADDTWGDLFSRILVERVEPRLGFGAPTVLFDYPMPEAALARPAPHDFRVAERFEIYACGVELANGFGELTDAAEQRRRLEIAMTEKARRYGQRWPIDEDFLAAVAEMPPASGCALGFDRLVMLAVGAPAIDDVMWGA